MGLLDQFQGPFAQWARANRNGLLGFGANVDGTAPTFAQALQPAWAGMAEGGKIDTQAQLLAAQEADRQRQIQETSKTRNSTIEWLGDMAKQDPRYMPFYNAARGGAPIDDIWNSALQMASDTAGGANDETFFGNAVPYTMDGGEIGIGQLGNRGTFRPVDMPGEGQYLPATRTINTETEQITINNLTGDVIARVPIQNEQAARDTAIGDAIGDAQGAAIVAAPRKVATADQMLETVRALRDHPSLPWIVGFGGQYNPGRPNTSDPEALSLFEQIRGQIFVQAYQDLKGGGTITEIEGQKAEQAMARLNRAMTVEDFQEALDDLIEVIEAGRDRALAAAGSATPTGGNTTSTGVTWSIE